MRLSNLFAVIQSKLGITLTLLCLAGSGVVFPATTLAFDPLAPETCQGNNANSSFCQNVSTESQKGFLGPGGVGTRIAQTIVFIVGALSVIMVIIGGLRYVLSGGDSNAVSGAKNTVLYALVGLAVAIFSQAIVTFVLSKL